MYKIKNWQLYKTSLIQTITTNNFLELCSESCKHPLNFHIYTQKSILFQLNRYVRRFMKKK